MIFIPYQRATTTTEAKSVQGIVNDLLDARIQLEVEA